MSDLLDRARRLLELDAAKLGPFSSTDDACTAEIVFNTAAIGSAPDIARKLLEVDEVLREAIARYERSAGKWSDPVGSEKLSAIAFALTNLRRRLGLGGG